MDGHRRLDAWQQARALVVAVYALTRLLPPEERYVVVTQLRRAAWSVTNNIAEGNAKLGSRELRRYFDIALGSLAEIDSMLVVLGDLYDIDGEAKKRVDALRIDVTRKIFGMLKSRAR